MYLKVWNVTSITGNERRNGRRCGAELSLVCLLAFPPCQTRLPFLHPPPRDEIITAQQVNATAFSQPLQFPSYQISIFLDHRRRDCVNGAMVWSSISSCSWWRQCVLLPGVWFLRGTTFFSVIVMRIALLLLSWTATFPVYLRGWFPFFWVCSCSWALLSRFHWSQTHRGVTHPLIRVWHTSSFGRPQAGPGIDSWMK
jgi:hypothetical protein